LFPELNFIKVIYCTESAVLRWLGDCAILCRKWSQVAGLHAKDTVYKSDRHMFLYMGLVHAPLGTPSQYKFQHWVCTL